MTTARASAVPVLRRLFFRRFFDNDLVAPNGGGEQNVSIVYTMLAVPGVLLAAPLILKYMNPYMMPGERLMSALDDKFRCLAMSMIVMGIVTVVEWDALALDARDVAVLGPLPVTRRLLLVAKMQALGLFVSTFLIVVNAVPSVLYPLILLGTLQVGLARAVWLIAVHGVVSLSAGAFGFFAVLSCRELLALVPGARTFRRLSLVVQSVLIVVFVAAFLLVPTLPSVSASVRSGHAGGSLNPPMWFLGLYESLTTGTVLNAPGVLAPIGPLRWNPSGAELDRAAYLAQMPQFTRLARTAAIALGAAILVALGGYALETRRLARRVGQARPVVPRVISRTASTLAQRVWVRDPLERATFFFVLQTCVRGATQRLYLAAGVAVTLAMLVAVVPAPELRALLRPSPEPTLALMTVQMFVICAASATLRLVCAAPTDLRANWIFRVTWAREPGKCFSGVRRAALAGIAVPLSILVLVDVRAWGLPFALVHLVFAALAAVAVVEWSFLDLRALPFTSAGGGRKAALIWRAASTLAISWPLGWLEYWGTRSPSQASIAVGALAMTAIGLAAFRARRLRAIEDVAFDEAPDLPTQRLGLGVE